MIIYRKISALFCTYLYLKNILNLFSHRCYVRIKIDKIFNDFILLISVCVFNNIQFLISYYIVIKELYIWIYLSSHSFVSKIVQSQN